MDNYGFVESAIENELCQSGVYASVTKGSSMRPLFKTNRDVVILKRCDAEPKKYDVVLYKDGTGKYILHRIVRVSDKCFVIRGDNTFINERVSKNCILAVLTEFNRKGKKHLVTDTIKRDGTRERHHFITLKVVTDERICDGYYYASAFKRLKRYLLHPEVLDKTLDSVTEDVD